jgi:hypothetical protein
MDQNGLQFEKLAFINVFHSNMSWSISYGLAVSVIRKIIIYFVNCLNNVQFYSGSKLNIIFG